MEAGHTATPDYKAMAARTEILNMPQFIPTYAMTLTQNEATCLIVALRHSLEAYDKRIIDIENADATSCVGVQKMLISELQNAQHGRKSDFVKLNMVTNREREAALAKGE